MKTRPKIVDAIEKNISMFSSENANVFVTRPDGLVVWDDLNDKTKLQELGALGCGLWQL